MKIASIIVAILHLALVVLCFHSAIVDPIHHGLTPIIVYTVDWPISYVVLRLSAFGLPLLPEAYTGRLVLDAVLLGLFGTLWWLFVVQIVWRGFASLWSDVRQWRRHNDEK